MFSPIACKPGESKIYNWKKKKHFFFSSEIAFHKERSEERVRQHEVDVLDFHILHVCLTRVLHVSFWKAFSWVLVDFYSSLFSCSLWWVTHVKAEGCSRGYFIFLNEDLISENRHFLPEISVSLESLYLGACSRFDTLQIKQMLNFERTSYSQKIFGHGEPQAFEIKVKY